MDIVDAQVHLNQLVTGWETAELDEAIKTSVVTMDAVGIGTVLIAELKANYSKIPPASGSAAPGSSIRGQWPFSERAIAQYPDRFGSLVRVNLSDSQLERLASDAHALPGVLSLRINPSPDNGELEKLQRGEFEPLLATAEKHQVPVFAHFPGRSGLLEPHLRQFPQLRIILDHCGVGVAPPTIGHIPPTLASSVTATLAERRTQLDDVVSLAQYPNLSVKWCHAPLYLSAEPYPFRDVLPLLRKVVDAFGVERVMWASDYTHSRTMFPMSWADSLHYLLDSDMLSDVEKEWILGRSVRHVLRWPGA
jgi:predicted TIM-barrel fold metal-dependent hydrolase